MSRISFNNLDQTEIQALSGGCICCGQCCAAFYVKLSDWELREAALRDEARGFSFLESDAVFIVRHCTSLTPEEALLRSPALISSPDWPRMNYYTCEYFRDDRKCQLDVDSKAKPAICKGYPWYGGARVNIKWLHPGCGYGVKKD